MAVPLFKKDEYHDRELFSEPTLAVAHRAPQSEDEVASERRPWGMLVCSDKTSPDAGSDAFTVPEYQVLREWGLLAQPVLRLCGATVQHAG